MCMHYWLTASATHINTPSLPLLYACCVSAGCVQECPLQQYLRFSAAVKQLDKGEWVVCCMCSAVALHATTTKLRNIRSSHSLTYTPNHTLMHMPTLPTRLVVHLALAATQPQVHHPPASACGPQLLSCRKPSAALLRAALPCCSCSAALSA